MPRFFFNYRERTDYTADDSGVVFQDFETAYLDAFNTAREMWRELMSQRKDPRTCSFEITDADGVVLALLPFAEVLETCTSQRTPPPPTAQSFAKIVDSAGRTKQALVELHHEIDRTRSELREVKALLGSIGRA